MRNCLAIAVALLLNLSPSTADLERAAALARWPHTDGERVPFHDRYLFLAFDRAVPLAGDTNVPQSPPFATCEVEAASRSDCEVSRKAVWPTIPERERGRRLTRAEEDALLGFGPDGVAD